MDDLRVLHRFDLADRSEHCRSFRNIGGASCGCSCVVQGLPLPDVDPRRLIRDAPAAPPSVRENEYGWPRPSRRARHSFGTDPLLDRVLSPAPRPESPLEDQASAARDRDSSSRPPMTCCSTSPCASSRRKFRLTVERSIRSARPSSAGETLLSNSRMVTSMSSCSTEMPQSSGPGPTRHDHAMDPPYFCCKAGFIEESGHSVGNTCPWW